MAPIPAANASARIYRNNTNLEEISDWITKIIVGLGLVQATTIWEKVWSLAGKFNEGIQNAGGGDVLFVLTVAAASIGGFLFFYLETRTRILLLLLDTEAASDHPEIARKFDKSSNAPITDLPVTATTGSRPSNRAIAAPEVASDRDVRSVPYSSLQTADQRAAWAAAQARAGNFPAATDAIRVAVQQKPKDPVLRVKLADIYILQQLWESALATLKEAEQISPNDNDILKRELYVSLYLEPPQSFRTALPIAEKLISNPNTANDPAVWLWQAAALGQKFKYLYDAGESLSSAGQTESAESVRSKALQAVQAVVQLAPDPNSAPRIFLRRIFDPAREQSPLAENDLEVFKSDPEFDLAIYGGEPASPASAGRRGR